ncbi:hypothetical protein ccbrp13_03330 [Ktedonobacteria bacterium brp13]|nr:hypothetical protein ccbrp13_03330 [Ktedonobacteria bacterium brp13]
MSLVHDELSYRQADDGMDFVTKGRLEKGSCHILTSVARRRDPLQKRDHHGTVRVVPFSMYTLKIAGVLFAIK